jgi:DNA polymerase-3 subunit delta
MLQKPEEVLKDFKAKKYLPVYFLHGEEPFFIDQIIDFAEKNILSDEEKSFNLSVFYGKDVRLQDILDAARRFPVVAEKQVIIVKEAQEISDLTKEESGAAKAKKSAEKENRLAKYSENPVPTTILLFAHKYKKIAANTKLYKALEKNVSLVESKKIYDNQVPAWVTAYFEDCGFQATQGATAMISENIGNDLSRISGEISKLLLNFVGKAKVTITEEIVSAHVGINRDYNVFELQKAIAQRNIVKSFRIAKYFASNTKANPVIPIIANLYGFFLKVMLVHQCKDKTPGGIAETLKINRFFADDYLLASKKYSPDKVLHVISALRTADGQSKGIGAMKSDAAILEELLCKILF